MRIEGFVTPPCCSNPSIASMDHRLGITNGSVRPIINRMCLNCGEHWYGDAETSVVQMPRRVWDRWVSGVST